MSWILILILLAAGLVLIVKGGDLFVNAAVWMAEKTGVPKLIIGATIVSIATTLPEMIVSFLAAGEGRVDMAIGNAVGSVTANVGLIMGIALICMPTAIRRRDYLPRTVLMLGAALILTVFGAFGSIGWIPGALLLVIFVLAMADNVRMAGREKAEEGAQAPRTAQTETAGTVVRFSLPEDAPAPDAGGAAAVGRAAALAGGKTARQIVGFVIGAAFIVIGSQLLVTNGSALAALLGVPERMISVSVIAVGTSLPELVTTISAIVKKQNALSFGNIIGANIIDLTLILPVSSLIAGQALPVSSQFAMFDIPACLLVGCIALLPSLITKKFHRVQGIVMVVYYLAYLVLTTTVLG